MRCIKLKPLCILLINNSIFSELHYFFSPFYCTLVRLIAKSMLIYPLSVNVLLYGIFALELFSA